MTGAEAVGPALAVGAAVGLIAAVVMDVPMAALSEGFTPAFVAAGALTGRDPDAVPATQAYAVHHLVGTVVGAGFGVGVVALEGTFGSVWPAGLAVALVVLFVLLGVFLLIVLPWVGFPSDRERAVTRAWVLSAFVYVVTLTFVGPLAMALR